MLAYVVKPPTILTPVTSEMTAAAVEKPATFSRDARISSRNSQLNIGIGIGWIAAETKIETSKMSTSEVRPATAAMPATERRQQ
jgi:hypothetical protein